MALTLRRRTFGELLSLSFSLAARHFPQLFAVFAVASLPQLVFRELFQRQVQSGDPEDLTSPLLLLLGYLIVLLFYPIAQGVAMYLVAGDFTDRRAPLGECLARAGRKFPALLLLGMITTVLYAIGFLLLLIPGLIFMAMYFVAGAALIIEDLPALEAMQRSAALSKGSRLKVFAFWVVIALLTFVVAGVIGGAAELAFTFGGDSGGLPSRVVTWLIGVAVGTIGTVAPVVYYFDLRVRKESFDVVALAAIVDAIAAREPR